RPQQARASGLEFPRMARGERVAAPLDVALGRQCRRQWIVRGTLGGLRRELEPLILRSRVADGREELRPLNKVPDRQVGDLLAPGTVHYDMKNRRQQLARDTIGDALLEATRSLPWSGPPISP